MKNSLKTIEAISQTCHMHTTQYQYNENIKKEEKYNKGRITSALWINEICYYFIQKEKLFLYEFIQALEKEKTRISALPNGTYKNGLLDQINTILIKINA